MQIWETRLEEKLVQRKSKIAIACLIDGLGDGDSYQSNIWSGVISTAKKLGVDIYCLQVGFYQVPPIKDSEQLTQSMCELVDKKKVKGLLIMGAIATFMSMEKYRALHKAYEPLPTISVGTPVEGVPYVTSENYKGVYQSVLHMVKVHHHKNIAYIRGPVEVPEAAARYQAYLDALHDCGIESNPDLSYIGNFLSESGMSAVKYFLDKKVKFDAILAANDNMIIGAIRELRNRKYKIPFDVAVAGFDDTEESKNYVPTITTVRQPIHELGINAVKLLLAKILNVDSPDNLSLDTEQVIRHSCGCTINKDSEIISQNSISFNPSINTSVLSNFRDSFVDEMMRLLNLKGRAEFMLVREITGTIYDHFFSFLKIKSSKQMFFSLIEDLFYQLSVNRVELTYWEYLIKLLSASSKVLTSEPEQFRIAEQLISDLKKQIHELTVNMEIYDNMTSTGDMINLTRISYEMITHYDFQQILKNIEQELPIFGIKKVFIILFEDKQNKEASKNLRKYSRFLLALNEKGKIDLKENVPFLTQKIFSTDILKKENALFIMPLYLANDFLGFVMFDPIPQYSYTYSMFQRYLSSALYGAILFRERTHAEQQLKFTLNELESINTQLKNDRK